MFKHLGLLLAYTPINMFQDMTRYVYAMYFIVALISTIAFGDIIGKNYIEDVNLNNILGLCNNIDNFVNNRDSVDNRANVYNFQKKENKIYVIDVLILLERNQMRFLS